MSKYTFNNYEYQGFVYTCSLPIREIELSPNQKWVAIASDQLTVRVINIADNKKTITLDKHLKEAKHVSWSPDSTHLAVSCTDGVIYVYSISGDVITLATRIDGVIRRLDPDSTISSKVAWHPDGTAFAAPTLREIQLVSVHEWKVQRFLADGHTGDITALAWSSNGAMLATAGKDNNILLWQTSSASIISRYERYQGVMDLAWHPTSNILSFTTEGGEVYIHDGFVPAAHDGLLTASLQTAPVPQINGRAPARSGQDAPNVELPTRLARPRPSPADEMDAMFETINEDEVDDDDFVEDDDGAGYTVGGPNVNGKRPAGYELNGVKRHAIQAIWQPQKHEAFQPGSTPWQGDRRYLCLNLLGFVWTVDQDTHHTVTVEFYDREFQRDFHFTDPHRYDKACLSVHGTLFSSQPTDNDDAILFYRPHETWTERNDWLTTLPKGEKITAISLSESFITVITSNNYVRVFTLFLTPYRVYRQKVSPAVTCASWRDYVLTMGNGPVDANGHATLLYSIDNVKRDETCQSEDIVALPPHATVKNVFFSDLGDPCIYDSTGTLLTLLHWRVPSQARWVPLLDTTQLARLASGRKTETYWPVAVAEGKFHCIILKGADEQPYFPKPLLTEFDFQIPTSGRSVEADEDDPSPVSALAAQKKLEETFVRTRVLASMLSDLLEATKGTLTQQRKLGDLEREGDKVLIQMMDAECQTGEERGMKALELVNLFVHKEQFLPLAKKVAGRREMHVLEDKIEDVYKKWKAETSGENDMSDVEY